MSNRLNEAMQTSLRRLRPQIKFSFFDFGWKYGFQATALQAGFFLDHTRNQSIQTLGVSFHNLQHCRNALIFFAGESSIKNLDRSGYRR
jgi:hypothetical protein